MTSNKILFSCSSNFTILDGVIRPHAPGDRDSDDRDACYRDVHTEHTIPAINTVKQNFTVCGLSQSVVWSRPCSLK